MARPFTIPLTVKQQGSTGAASFRAQGEGVVKLSDYGIAKPSPFGVSVSDEVKIRLNLTAREHASAAPARGDARRSG